MYDEDGSGELSPEEFAHVSSVISTLSLLLLVPVSNTNDFNAWIPRVATGAEKALQEHAGRRDCQPCQPRRRVSCLVLGMMHDEP